MLEIGIDTPLVNDILAGNKTIKGRLGKSKFLKLRVGDKLSIREDIWKDGQVVQSIPECVQVIVTQLLYFESLEEMLNSVDYEQAIPSAKNAQDALAVYRQFYTTADEREYGVVAITFELEEF